MTQRRKHARTIWKQWAGLSVITALLALLLACGGGSDKVMAADFPIIVSQGQDTLGGEQVAMASLVGERPVIMNFWAAECPPCRAELPRVPAFLRQIP